MNEKIKIIYLGDILHTSKGDFKYFVDSLDHSKFKRTKLAITDQNGTRNIEDLSLRSSWTYEDQINIYHQEINPDTTFKLLKYEKNDFFKLHSDHKGTHTCLILGGTKIKGGILRLTNNMLEIKINPEDMKDKYYMIIFSIDFLHEVSPIIEGQRFVLKTTLYNNLENKPENKYENKYENDCQYEDCYSSEEELDLGGGGSGLFGEDEGDDY
tara:strand:- start:584 stop:1219 length:636 start_codon:yes stop_codon:yes gene_type:complete